MDHRELPTAGSAAAPPTAGTTTFGATGTGPSGQGGTQLAATSGTAPLDGSARVGAAAVTGVAAGTGGAAPARTGGTGAGGIAAAGAGGTGNGMGAVACTITPSLTMSPVISTVAAVEFATDLPTVDTAYIEFGLDTSYGMTAPVDLDEPNHRTLLLGMKASREYHYRVVVSAANGVCTGPDNTLVTGALPSTLLTKRIETPQPNKLSGGFIVTGFFSSGMLFIIDGDGDYVWWFQTSSDFSSVRMSWDGKFIWARSPNPLSGAGFVHRVSMDGMDFQTWDGNSEFGDSHHDLAALPDGGLLFLQHHAGQCDTLDEWRPDGQVTQIIDGSQVHGSNTCWMNSLHYYPEDDTITWSDRIYNGFVKMRRTGEVLWVLGGENSTFASGDGLDWFVQHGHHLYAPDRLLMFENRDVGQTSMAYELALDEATSTVTRVWQYDGGYGTPILGDVQRLDNGNTLVNYSMSGVIHEVDSNEQLVRSIVWDFGGELGYSQHRDSLYGPPPR